MACLSPGTSKRRSRSGRPLAPNGQEVADVCESIDVASLDGDALIDYLRTTSESCLKRTLLISNNSSIREDVPTIFSDRNMQSVFAEIEKSASAYDGTNSTGMAHLWFFVQVGYDYHRFFPGETHNERAPGGVGSAGRQGRHLRCRGGATDKRTAHSEPAPAHPGATRHPRRATGRGPPSLKRSSARVVFDQRWSGEEFIRTFFTIVRLSSWETTPSMQS